HLPTRRHGGRSHLPNRRPEPAIYRTFRAGAYRHGQGVLSSTGDHAMGLKKISGIASPSSRDGLTLFEVMLALVILLGSLAVLTQHMRVGAQAGVQGQLNTQAAMLAETKMAEVLGGAEPLAAVADVPLDTSGT